MPFFVIQNTYFVLEAGAGYYFGLADEAAFESEDPFPLGTLTGPTGGGEPITVGFPGQVTTGSMSSKAIVTSKTLLDGTDELSFAPDSSDCTGIQLAVCSKLKGASMNDKQLLLPPMTLAPTGAPTRTPTEVGVPSPTPTPTGIGHISLVPTECFCTVVCPASFYIKTEEVSQPVGILVIVTLIASGGGFVNDGFAQLSDAIEWLF